ncbi:MAG: RtcB family protein [Rectinema sp.]|nr:RtcB family protein [Rectinema sp.]
MEITRINPFLCEIAPGAGMRVPARVYVTEALLPALRGDRSIEQLLNMAKLPGIVRYSIGMPDIHQGFAFPIGGVAAFDAEEGVVSPGGVGFDINCGVRVILTRMRVKDLAPYLERLGKELFARVPAGVGSKGTIRFSAKDARQAMNSGLVWAREHGFADDADLDRVEDRGILTDADADAISDRALERGKEEFGTLGAGNHFLEIDRVDRIFEPRTAASFGLFEEQVLIWIHTGSRGLGHQIATDFIERMRPRMSQYGLVPYEHDFVSIPLKDPLADQYLAAMAAAANFAWVNRQLITHTVRETFRNVLGSSLKTIGMQVLYDVAHNIARFELHEVNGEKKRLLVHRKGATRAFASGHPVLLPGDMLRGSYILVGTKQAMEESFGSVAHGAGRRMSRHSAVREISFNSLMTQIRAEHIGLYAADRRLACEEAPNAYKDIDTVAEIVAGAGLARPIARSRPLLVIKG